MAKRARPITETIQRIIAQDNAEYAVNPQRLRNGLEKVFDAAATGDLDALTFIRDTVQGKPAQSVTVSGDEDKPLISLIRTVVLHVAQEIDAPRVVQDVPAALPEPVGPMVDAAPDALPDGTVSDSDTRLT